MSWRPGACWRFRIWSSSFLETPGHQDQNQLCPLVSLSLRPWILTTTPTVPRTVKPTSLCCSQRAPTSIPISHFQIASWKMGEGAESRCQNKALGNTLNRMEHWVQPRQVLSCHIHSRANWGVLVYYYYIILVVCFSPSICLMSWDLNSLQGSHWEYFKRWLRGIPLTVSDACTMSLKQKSFGALNNSWPWKLLRKKKKKKMCRTTRCPQWSRMLSEPWLL